MSFIYLFVKASFKKKKKTCFSYVGFFEKTTPKSLYFEDFFKLSYFDNYF